MKILSKLDARNFENLNRNEVFFAILLLSVANGLAIRVLESLSNFGLFYSTINTFEISAIVWLSCAAGFQLIFDSISINRHLKLSLSDIIICACSIILVLIPVSSLSWLSVDLICLRLIINEPREGPLRRGAVILLAATIPMLWSRFIYKFFANYVLNFDAGLVAWLLGTNRDGNVVEFADRTGRLIVLTPCSSLANVSLCVLCWIAATRLVRRTPSNFDALWCAAACGSVVALNVTRMSLMGLSQPFYHAIHGAVGQAIFSVAISATILGFTALGVRRELFKI